ncbi:MAG: PH domain-containing protein [Bacteroidota bacterium]|nr:PH domain-containing protein [Bacteroidota bacterium]
MVEADTNFRRVHPLSLVIIMSSTAVYGVVLVLSIDVDGLLFLIAAGLLGVSGLLQILPRYIFFKYLVSEGEIVIHSGVLKRVRRNITSERIQNVAFERNIGARLLNLTAVKIETAGSIKAEGVLQYVPVSEAERIRTLLRSAKPAEGAPDASPEAVTPDYSLPLPQLLVSGMYTFSLIYFAAGWAIVSQLDQIGLIPLEEVLTNLVADQIQEFSGNTPGFSTLLVLPIILAGLLLGWITGICIHVARYYGFQLELRPTKIHRRFGLFTLRETTIPYPRVQSLVLKSNPVMRLHNRFRLALQTLAFDTSERGMQMAIPLARLPRLLPVAQRIDDFTLPDTYRSVSPISIRRMGLRYTLAMGALVTLVQLLWSPAIWGLTLLPTLWVLAWMQYRCHGWAFNGSHLYVRRGIFWQRIWIVPATKFQAIQKSATFLQRRMGICQVTVDTAGASFLLYPRIVDVSVATADELVPALYEAFRRAMALNPRADGIDAVDDLADPAT